MPFATDAGYLTPAYGDPPTVILGPGETEQAHKTDEWCSLTRIEQATELYAELIAAWCSVASGRRRCRDSGVRATFEQRRQIGSFPLD